MAPPSGTGSPLPSTFSRRRAPSAVGAAPCMGSTPSPTTMTALCAVPTSSFAATASVTFISSGQ